MHLKVEPWANGFAIEVGTEGSKTSPEMRTRNYPSLSLVYRHSLFIFLKMEQRAMSVSQPSWSHFTFPCKGYNSSLLSSSSCLREQKKSHMKKCYFSILLIWAKWCFRTMCCCRTDYKRARDALYLRETDHLVENMRSKVKWWKV